MMCLNREFCIGSFQALLICRVIEGFCFRGDISLLPEHMKNSFTLKQRETIVLEGFMF